MQDTPYLLGFTAGELSPWLSCRFDLQAYQRGAALIRNFLVQPYGGLKRRPGTRYVADAASPDGSVRLFPFRFSEADVMMLEFFPGGVRFFKEGALLCKNGATYQVQTPWETPEALDALQFVQLNDVVYIVSPASPPYMLQRFGDVNWRLRAVQFEPYPRETYVEKDTSLTVIVEEDSTAVLQAGSNVFTEDMVGKEYVLVDTEMPARTYFENKSFSLASTLLPDLRSNNAVVYRVYHEVDSESKYQKYYTCIRQYRQADYNGRQSAVHYPYYFQPGVMVLPEGSPLEVYGDWTLRTYGEWNASWEIWRSYDTPAYDADFHRWRWTCIKSFSQSAFEERRNWEITGSEKLPCRLVLVCRSSKASSVSAMMKLTIHASRREYKFRITGFVSAKQVAAESCLSYVDPVASFSSSRWSFGAFGARNGYPKLVGFHQNRLWFGGMPGLPTTLLASCVGDFCNFRVDSDDDSALHLTLATSDRSRICWICPARNLLVGTSESEWILTTPDGGAIKAVNATFHRQSSVGSAEMPAGGVENTVFYVQRGGKRLREISYKLEADGFTSTDVCLLAGHLFTSGIREWAVQRGGDTRLWVLMRDGSLAVLTLNMEQHVTAWQRVESPGRSVLHLAAIPRPDGLADEVWLVLHNPAGGTCTLERMVEGACHLDGLCEGPVAPAPHLAGLQGAAYPPGRPELAVPVEFGEDGSFSVPGAEEGSTWCYGALFESGVLTLPMEREFTFNTTRQEGRVRLRLLESAPVFQYKAGHVERWETYDPARECLPTPYTGSVRVSHLPAPGVGQGFALKVQGLHDFQLLGLTVEFDFHGR